MANQKIDIAFGQGFTFEYILVVKKYNITCGYDTKKQYKAAEQTHF